MTDDMTSWFNNGDKYALVGLGIMLDEPTPLRQLAPDLWIGSDVSHEVPPFWRDTLGSMRAEEVEDCNVFLMTKMAARSPSVLDDESQLLQRRVMDFYLGLVLTARFGLAHEPVIIGGSKLNGALEDRQYSNHKVPVPIAFDRYPAVRVQAFEDAAKLATNLGVLYWNKPFGGTWRLNRALRLFLDTTSETEFLDRIHQFARCIEGLIQSEPGMGAKQFKSRTTAFIGPRHHDLMGEIYEVRGSVEHLREHRYLEGFDRGIRLELMRKDAIIEYVARRCLARILGDSALWGRFGNATALETFWKLPESDRVAIWGAPINPLDAIADFEPDDITDEMLGKS